MNYRLGPLKGNWMFVSALCKSVNCLTDLSGVGGAEAFQDGSCQNAEPHFDLVQPGGMGRCVVKMHGWMAGHTCVPSITYQCSAVSTTALSIQIASPNNASADVTPTLNLGTSGFGLAQYELQVTVTLVCGTGACSDIAQATLSTSVNVFA